MLLGEEGCFSVVLLGECPSDNEIVVVCMYYWVHSLGVCFYQESAARRLL